MKKNIEIYIIRHSETIWNQKKLLQGRQDIPLSEKGIEQAYEMSANFKNLNLDFIGVSPLIRTQQTARVISKELDLPIKIFEELKARDYGLWEGKTIDAIRKENKELFQSLSHYSMEDVFSNPPIDSMESYESVSKRALQPIFQLQGNALLITHSGVMTSILLALKFPHPHVPLVEHTGYIKLKREGGHLHVEDVKGLTVLKYLTGKDSSEPVFIF